MAGLLKASNMIQPAYLSPHRKRRNSLWRTYHMERRLDTVGLKCVDRNTTRKHLRMVQICSVYANHLRPVSFVRREDCFASLNVQTSVSQLSSTLRALPSGSLGLPSDSLYSAGSMESTVPDMMHPLLNFLVTAYSSLHEQALVATIILAAIVVAAFITKSGNESVSKVVDNSLFFVSRPSQFNRFISMRCPSMSMNLPAKINVFERAHIEYQRMCLHAPDGGTVAIDWPAELDFVGEEDHSANTLLLVPGTTEGSEDEGVQQFVFDAMRYGYLPIILNPRGCANSPVTTPRVFSGADSDDVRLVVQHIVRERPGSSVMGVGWGWGANMLTKYLGEESGSTSLMAAVAISNPFDLQLSSMFLGMTNSGQLDRVMAKGLVNILKENKVLFAGHSKGFDLKAGLASTSIRDFDASISRVTHGFDTLDEFYSASSSTRFISSVQVPLLSVQGEDFSMPVTSIPYSILEENPYTVGLVVQVPANNKSSTTRAVREPGSASRHCWSHVVAFEWLAAVEVALLRGYHPLLNIASSYDKLSSASKAVVPSTLLKGVSIEGADISRRRKDSKRETSVEALNDEETFDDVVENEPSQSKKLSVVAGTDEVGGSKAVDETGAPEVTKRRNPSPEADNIPSVAESTPQEAERHSLKKESNPQEVESISSKSESTSQEAESISSKSESTPQEAGSISSKSETTIPEAESTSLEAKSTSPGVGSTSPEPAGPPPEENPEEAVALIQMRDATESVMNVLDLTMPGTLSDEKKAQVLTAVGEGESMLTALQEAVPEDVRGSMATAVSGAVQARGLSFKMVGFANGMPPPRLPDGLLDSIKEKIAGRKKESTSTTPHVPAEGTRDMNATKTASSEKVDGEGRADPVESQEADNQGSENSAVKQEDKSHSVPENHFEGDSSNGSKESKSETFRESSESKPSVGKQEESNHEEPKDSTQSKSSQGKQDDPKPEVSKDGTANKSDGGKLEEAKSEGPKESSETKPVEGKHEEVKPEESKASTEDKPVRGKDEELKTGEPKESSESKSVGGKHEESKSDDPKDSSVSKSVGGKQAEPADKHGVEQAGDKKDGAQEATVDEAVPNVDKKSDSIGDSNGTANAKEETKPSEENLPSPDAAVPAATPPPSPVPPAATPPVPENSTSPALSTPSTGDPPPLDMTLAVQALTGFDDSTQMAVTNVFGVVEGMLEKMEQEQVAAVPDATANEKELSDGKENNNSEGDDKKNKDKKASDDTPPPESKEEKGATEAAVTDMVSNSDDGGGDINARGTAKSPQRDTKESTDQEQEENRRGKKNAVSVLENPKQENSVDISSSNQGSGTVPQSKVMMTQRVGNSTLMEPMLEDQPLKTHPSPSVNGAFPKSNGSSLEQKGVEAQQSGQPNFVKEPNSVKPVNSKMTIEQLSQEVDQERIRKGDDSSAKVNELHDEQTIEAEGTGNNETETSSMVENIVKDALKLEVLRRLGAAGMESLGIDLEQEVSKVAVSVADAVQRFKKDPGADSSSAGKLGILPSNSVITTLGTVMGGTDILGRLVPVGVLAGVILASLGAVYLIITDNEQGDGENENGVDEEGASAREEEESESFRDSDNDDSSWHEEKASALDVPVSSVSEPDDTGDTPLSASSELGEDPWLEPAEAAADEYDENSASDDEVDEKGEKVKQGKMMGMMAAAVTGGATLARMSSSNVGAAGQQGDQGDGKEPGKGGSIISNIHPLAEKALSVAAPVVPTNEDGEIDHERLVAMLAELGQRGGFLRLIGKVALLWGGLRGAMSLTDRLLVFLQINRRPLHLRLVGFSALVVLLWSPVLIPVMPSLLHQWATKTPSGVADAASAVGLYGAVLILVTIWGKRVRGYNKPLLYYGLRLWSKRKAQDLGLGLALGGGLVSSLYFTNFILGYAQFNWGTLLATNVRVPGTFGVMLFTAAKVSKLVGKAAVMGLAVALVEEVLFRAWLQEEIAVDLGFHRAVFLSATAFALVHWTPAAMPGLWFLAVSLAGARAKMNRNLAFPIGLHAGLVAVNFVMTAGGLVQFLPHAPTWFTGAHVKNPLAGAFGTGLMALLAVTLYPRTTTQPLPASTVVDHAV